MQFPPHDFHQIFPAGHAYTHHWLMKELHYDILVFQHYLHHIFVIDIASKKCIRKMHSVLKAR